MTRARLSENDVLWVINHLIEYGDTDIFPYPPEFEFLNDSKGLIAERLSQIDLTNYHPVSLVESLVPKSRFGFRVAHQLYPIDTVIFTASLLSIADQIETNRSPLPSAGQLNSVYSYRYVREEDSYSLFCSDHKYRDWLECLSSHAAFGEDYTHVVATDISDFYQRIYRHRLENCLNTYTDNSPHVRFLERCMNDWRGRQSFGIPVGNNASRLLAEAALCDTDQAILAEGYDFTRYVDDIVLFIRSNQDPYTALAFLAQHLMVNEGLSLNAQKTRIYSREAYLQNIQTRSGEDTAQADTSGIERLYHAAYGEDEIDPEALAELQARDLLPELEEEVSRDYWDTGKIRILLRAIKLTRSRTASEFLASNIETLLPFARDVVLAIAELTADGDETFRGMTENVINLLLSDTLRSLDATRAWLFELFIRDVVPITRQQIRRLGALTGTLDKRCLNTLRSKNGDVNYFRRNKTRINELSVWEQPSFIRGARCLPSDEYVHWVRSIRTRLGFPLSVEYCDWCTSTSD